jgi:uncharacterized protein YjaG (DUF416 family)
VDLRKGNLMNEEHSTHEMVKGLHERFTGFEKRIDVIETRVGTLEKGLAADVAHLEKHESEADLKGDAMLEKLNGLISSFNRHAEAEERDRMDVIRGLRNTIRSVLLGAASIVGMGFTLLWQTGGLA